MATSSPAQDLAAVSVHSSFESLPLPILREARTTMPVNKKWQSFLPLLQDTAFCLPSLSAAESQLDRLPFSEQADVCCSHI